MRDLERADNIEILGRGGHEAYGTFFLLITVQHAVGIDNRALANPFLFVHCLAVFPLQRHPALLLRVGAVDMPVDEHHAPVMVVHELARPDRVNRYRYGV